MKHSQRFVALVNDAKSRVVEISPEETLAKMEGESRPLLVDVREESEWEQGRIRGAVYLGKGIIERDIESLVEDLNQEIILYCGGGYRSALAADSLQKMGFSNVASLTGGWRGWNDRGLPTES